MKNSLLNVVLRGITKNGKNILTVTIVAIIFTLSAGFIVADEVASESDECLEVVGLALNEKNQQIDGVSVKLFKKNEEMEWSEVTSVSHHDHNFKFVLCENEYYTIEISKPGYVTRTVAVSTFLPEDVDPKPLFSFLFEVKMFKEKAGMDDYYLDFPVALIGYNKNSGVFENSYTYTHHIKSKIQQEENRLLVERGIN